MHTYAVMGVNTAFLQAAVVARARVKTMIPAKIETRLDVMKGNFKFQFHPIQSTDKIASLEYVPIVVTQYSFYQLLFLMHFYSFDQQC